MIPDVEARTSATFPGLPAEAWQRHGHEIAAALATDPGRGLRRDGGPSPARAIRPDRSQSRGACAGAAEAPRQFANPLIVPAASAVLVSLVAWALEGGEAAPYDAIVIAAIVLANAVLGYVQEARAEQPSPLCSGLTAATARVLRDGREERIPAAEVVPGDVLLLAKGDAVAADGRLV